ncbi:hypothetical protein CY35_12G009100 [Sphagnum magellanicum]|nr:hypothetical protein CY35_12G009100 [Sphagnum magellanicum]
MAFVAGLEAHLRMISTEATRKYPIVKDAAERAMFKVQLLSSTSDVAGCDDILKTHLLACELKNTKLSISGLVGMEKLIAHDAVLPSALPSVLATLKEDQVMYAGSLTNDQSAMCIKQLKTLQTALTILQSQLHPTDEELQDRHIQQQPEFLHSAHAAGSSGQREAQWIMVLCWKLEHALQATEAAFLEMADRLLHENSELMVMDHVCLSCS